MEDSLLKAIGAIVWEANARTWEFTYVSPQAERMLGYPLDHWFGDQEFWSKIIHPEDRDAAIAFCLNSSATQDEFEFEYRAVANDGRVLWLRDIVSVVRDEQGPCLLRGIMLDITNQKAIEQDLRFRTTLLECENQAAIDGILVVSPDERILSFNHRFAEMWQLSDEVLRTGSDEQLLNAAIHHLVDPDAFRYRVEYLYQNPHEHSRDELHLKDGRVFDRYSAPVCSPDGETLYGRVWFFRDITDLKASEQRKDEFLALLGHELRNPLASILTATELLKLRGHEREVADRAGEIIARQVRQMVRLVDDLLDLGRITRGAIELRTRTLNLEMVLNHALETARPLLDSRSHNVTVSLPNAPIYLDADPARL